MYRLSLDKLDLQFQGFLEITASYRREQ